MQLAGGQKAEGVPVVAVPAAMTADRGQQVSQARLPAVSSQADVSMQSLRTMAGASFYSNSYVQPKVLDAAGDDDVVAP